MIQEAVFTSVWDNEIEIHTDCMVNTETKEVFDIELVDIDEYDVDVCTEEYITLMDGHEYGVYQKGNAENGDYWYE